MAAALRGRPLDMTGSQVEVSKTARVPDLSGIDPRMQPLLRTMLEPDPARRLGSMAEVRDWRTPAREERPPARRRSCAAKPRRPVCRRVHPHRLPGPRPHRSAQARSLPAAAAD